MAHDHNSQPTGTEHHKPEIIIETGHGKIIIDLEDLFHKGHPYPKHDAGEVVYHRIRVDGQHHDVNHSHMAVHSILNLVGKDPAHFNLLQSKGKPGHTELVHLKEDETVDFSAPGIEKFITVPKPVHLYHFKIDQKEYETKESQLTVRRILVEFAQVDPTNKVLAMKVPNNYVRYTNLEQVISLADSPKFTLFDVTPTGVSCL